MSRIITFYSYKGGVGRTFALANVGTLLALMGKKVLLIDGDLEAPGLERYFEDKNFNPIEKNKGLMQLLKHSFFDQTVNWREYVQQVDGAEIADETGARVDFDISIMPSGAGAPEYVNDLRGFSWTDFMNGGGGTLLERWREEWMKEFDFVLLDSRTGLTDIGGIFTILLPDFLVLVFSANDQSLEGALSAMFSAQSERQKLSIHLPPLTIFPLLSRFDRRAEDELANKWLARIAADWKPAFDDWLPTKFKPIQIIELTKIPYVTRYSFGEPLPVLTHSITDPELPGFYLQNVARLLATDFRDAAQIINPKAVVQPSRKELLLISVRGGAVDDNGIYRALHDLELELGVGEEFIDSLAEVGNILCERSQFLSAEPLIRRALDCDEMLFGSDHRRVGRRLNDLSILLRATNRNEEAEQMLRRALAIDEKQGGNVKAQEVVPHISNLSTLLHENGKYEEAEQLGRSALMIAERELGPNDPSVGKSLSNLAQTLQATGRFKEAEGLVRRSLAIFENAYGTEDQLVAAAMNNLASLLEEEDRGEEAEPLMRRSLEITEKGLGKEHPEVAIRLNNLASYLQKTRPQEAEPLMRRALSINEKCYGSDSPFVATILNNLAQLLSNSGRFAEAEPLMWRSLAIDERNLGTSHPKVAVRLTNLAQFLHQTGRTEDCESLLQRSIEIVSKTLGEKHARFGMSLNNLGQFYRKTNRLSEAEPLLRRSITVVENAFDENHSDIAICLCNLGELLFSTKRADEAEPFVRRAIEISQKKFGIQSQIVLQQKQLLGRILLVTNRRAEAELLFREGVENSRSSVAFGTNFLPRALVDLAVAVKGGERESDSDSLIQESINAAEQIYGTESDVFVMHLILVGKLYQRLRRFTDAETTFVRASQISTKIGKVGDYLNVEITANLQSIRDALKSTS